MPDSNSVTGPKLLAGLVAAFAVIISLIALGALATAIVPHDVYRSWVLSDNSVGGKIMGAIGLVVAYAVAVTTYRRVLRRLDKADTTIGSDKPV